MVSADTANESLAERPDTELKREYDRLRPFSDGESDKSMDAPWNVWALRTAM
jgi:hypothetical protein